MNEIADLKFSIDFKPSEIKLENEKELKALIDKTTDYYNSLVFTEDNIPEAKQARADLNKVAKQIDEKRKSVKKQFNEPLRAFEDKMNNYKQEIVQASQAINESVTEYEEKETQYRKNEIVKTVEKLKEKFDVKTIEIDSAWTNKTAFTKKGQPTKKTIDAIRAQLKSLQEEQERKKGDYSIIENYAKVMDLESESWKVLLDFGQTAPEVMAQMDKAKKQEQIKEPEHVEEAKEVTQPKRVEEVKKERELQTAVLKITGTIEQFKKFNRYLIENGIQVEEVR